MIIIASIFIFCAAAVFRLLDNSSGLLIAHGISVSPFYLSREEIKHHRDTVNDDPILTRSLNQMLLFQKLHKLCLVLAILSFIGGVVYEFVDPTLIYLF